MRLFVAVDLDDKIREKIAPLTYELSKFGGVKTVEPGNLHITLLFLGEVRNERVGVVENALSGVEFKPFKIRIKGMGGFPNSSSPRVIWVGVEEDGELRKLADSVYMQLKKLGFRRDKEFSAHITVGRVKRRNPSVRDFIHKYSDAEFGEMDVDSFKLKQSILRPQGPVYKDVRVFKHES